MKDEANSEPPSGTIQSKKRKVPIDEGDENSSITVATPESTGNKPSPCTSSPVQSTSSAVAGGGITVQAPKTKGSRSTLTVGLKNRSASLKCVNFIC